LNWDELVHNQAFKYALPMTQIIFLNGASSAGKTTLSHALQAQLEQPYLHFAEDMFFATLPEKPFSQEEWMLHGQRVYNGFTQCVRTMVECENRLIVDTVAWHPGSIAGFVQALEHVDVLSVGVYCDLTTLEQREQQRGNRSPGLARKQFDRVHAEALYDVEIDTSSIEMTVCVQKILSALEQPGPASAFARLRARLTT
jgi:chloramphenicol 3-O phosphotransferase